MITGAIFDVDGTLFDSMYVWDTIGGEYLRSIGYEPNPDINERFKKMTIIDCANYYRDEYGVKKSVEELVDGINNMVEKYYFYEIQPKDGILSFLEKLSEKGVKMSIATATDEYLVDAALKRCNMRQYFNEIITCTQVGTGKREPKIYRTALESIGTQKNKTVVFEDMYFASLTAKNDGFLTAGIYDSHEKHQEEFKKSADYYLQDYCDFDAFWKKFILL